MLSVYHYQELERLQALTRTDARILLTPNHCDHADGLAMFELAEQVGRPFCHMATHELFEGRWGIRYFMFPRVGVFPIDLEGGALSALRTAKDVLVRMNHPLVVYPEGEVYHLNDRVMPLREGAASMALAAQRALKEEAPVFMVPVALKYHYPDADLALARLGAQLAKLEGRLTLASRPEEPLVDRVHRFGEALLSLKELQHRGAVGTGSLAQRIRDLRDSLLEDLEQRYLGEVGREVLPERVTAVRRRIQELLREPGGRGNGHARGLADLSTLFLVLQLFSYPGDYVAENPSVERIAETLIKLEQDLAGGGYVTPVTERELTIRIGEPLDMRDYLKMKSRDAAVACTRELFGRLQGELDTINGVERAGQRASA